MLSKRKAVIILVALVTLLGAATVVAIYVSGAPVRPLLTECRDRDSAPACDRAYAAFVECSGTTHANWGLTACRTAVQLHDDCHEIYRQNPAACKMIALDMLDCSGDRVSVFECGDYGYFYLDCLDEPGASVAGCKGDRRALIDCLKRASWNEPRCKELEDRRQKMSPAALR